MSSDYGFFYELEDKKRKISQAAVELFAKKSFSQTTVKEITIQAGVGKGTFYNYFDSKVSLLEFLLEYGTNKMIDDVKEKIRDFKDPIIKLERAIDGQLEFYYSNQKYFIFYLREICNYREDLKKQIVELKKEYLTIIEDIIKEGCKRRVFKDVDLEITASGLFGLISVFASNQVLFSSEFSLDNIKTNIKKVLLNGLLRG